MIRIKSVVVGQAIRELDVNGGKTGLHQFQIDQQAPCAAIAVDEGMNTLELYMEPGQFGNDVLGALCIARYELLHAGLDQIGLHRLMLRTHDADRHPAVHAPVIFLIRQDQEVDLLNDALR